MILASLIINFILGFITITSNAAADPGLATFLIFIVVPAWVSSLVGSQVYSSNPDKKWALVLGQIGFVVFFPIGLIGLIGLRKKAEEQALKEFQEKKRAQKI